MATPQMETKEQNIQGEFSTAEVTHLVKSVEMEGVCYLRNHLAMSLSGTQGPLRQWHDNVTRPNLERLNGCLAELGMPLPFATPLEDRENEIKAKLQTGNVSGTVTEGEAMRGILMDADHLVDWYAMSFSLSTNQKVLDVFRRNLQTIMDQRQNVVESFRRTKEFVQPPLAQKVKLVGAQTRGVTARRG